MRLILVVVDITMSRNDYLNRVLMIAPDAPSAIAATVKLASDNCLVTSFNEADAKAYDLGPAPVPLPVEPQWMDEKCKALAVGLGIVKETAPRRRLGLGHIQSDLEESES